MSLCITSRRDDDRERRLNMAVTAAAAAAPASFFFPLCVLQDHDLPFPPSSSSHLLVWLLISLAETIVTCIR